MAEPETKNADQQERGERQAAWRRPEKSRKVWAERYDDGDMQIELGHMEDEELYLFSEEVDALREVLDELEVDDE